MLTKKGVGLTRVVQNNYFMLKKVKIKNFVKYWTQKSGYKIYNNYIRIKQKYKIQLNKLATKHTKPLIKTSFFICYS